MINNNNNNNRFANTNDNHNIMETVGGNYKFIYNMIEQSNRYALHFLFIWDSSRLNLE